MNLTDKVIGGVVVGLAVYETYTLVNKTKNDTISESFWSVSGKRPVVPFALGFLMGHFFWQAVGDDPAGAIKEAVK